MAKKTSTGKTIFKIACATGGAVLASGVGLPWLGAMAGACLPKVLEGSLGFLVSAVEDEKKQEVLAGLLQKPIEQLASLGIEFTGGRIDDFLKSHFEAKESELNFDLPRAVVKVWEGALNKMLRAERDTSTLGLNRDDEFEKARKELLAFWRQKLRKAQSDNNLLKELFGEKPDYFLDIEKGKASLIDVLPDQEQVENFFWKRIEESFTNWVTIEEKFPEVLANSIHQSLKDELKQKLFHNFSSVLKKELKENERAWKSFEFASSLQTVSMLQSLASNIDQIKDDTSNIKNDLAELNTVLPLIMRDILNRFDALENTVKEFFTLNQNISSLLIDFGKGINDKLVKIDNHAEKAADYSERTYSVIKKYFEMTSANSAIDNSIAVLPFTNFSKDEENEYFCEGLADQILNSLAKIDDLKVLARTWSFSFKGKKATVSEIGKILNVKTLLEGSVRKHGNHVRISVHLVNSSNGFHLWTHTYDREMSDILDLQDEITLKIVTVLKAKILGEEKAAILNRSTNNPIAYELYLKGLFHFRQHTIEGWEKSIEYFQKAIDEDSNYALAYAGLASVIIFPWYFGFLSSQEAIPRAKYAAERAIELDEDLDEAYIATAQINLFHDWNLEKARLGYEKAITLNPKNAYAHHQYGLCLAIMERREQAIIEAEKAIALEPISIFANFQVGWIYFWVGLLDDATRYAQRLIEMSPKFYGGYFQMGAVLIIKGENEKALRLIEKSIQLDNKQAHVKSMLGQVCGFLGIKSKADKVIKELKTAKSKNRSSSFNIARVFNSIRDTEKTFEWLEKALEERNGEMVYLKLESEFNDGEVFGKDFVEDSRLQDLLFRMGWYKNLGDEKN